MSVPGTAAVLRSWTRRLAAAGVPSPEHDARALAAFVLEVPGWEVGLIPSIPEQDRERIAALVERRALREPLQHIVGSAAFLDLELEVGPGVFVPRPETEAVAAWAIERLLARRGPQTVVDLCTGTGALALAVATRLRDARVVGVEKSPEALAYALRNLQRCRPRIVAGCVELLQGDATDTQLLAGLSGRVDAVISNPPYIPRAAVPRDPEVRDHDPGMALYGGDDGLDVVRGIAPVARRLLRPGGILVVEHGDEQGGSDGVPGVLGDPGAGFDSIAGHRDLAGRPRFTTAQRSA